MRFINQQAKPARIQYGTQSYVQLCFTVVLNFCGTWNKELWEMWSEGWKMVGTALFVYRNGHLVRECECACECVCL